MSQKIYASILFLIVGLNVYSQSDTIKITNKLDSNSTQYLTPMEYAFMFHEDTPWMLKGGINSEADLLVAFERRIKGGFTANISFLYSRSSFSINRNNFLANIETRYYYNMQLRNKSRNTPFNLSGNYFSLGYETSNRKTSIEKKTINGSEYIEYKTGNNSVFFLKWGMQRRYLKNGFIDAGVKADYSLNGDFQNSFELLSVTSIGLAFAKDKSSLNVKNLCSVTKCFESEKSVLKLNLSGLFEIVKTSHDINLRLNPEVTHEIKLGKSPLSINNTINASLDYFYTSADYNSNFNINPTRGFIYYGPEIDRQQFLVNIGYLFETRYYFNLKNRILKGKTGNGLSADYVSLGAYNYYQNNDYINYMGGVLKGSDNFNFLQPQLNIGSQRFVGDRFYYDLQAGIRFTDIIDRERVGNNRSSAELLLRSKVGFRF